MIPLLICFNGELVNTYNPIGDSSGCKHEISFEIPVVKLVSTHPKKCGWVESQSVTGFGIMELLPELASMLTPIEPRRRTEIIAIIEKCRVFTLIFSLQCF